MPASVLLVAAILPFEYPIAGSIAGFTLTTAELAIAAALVAGAWAWIRQPAALQWRTPMTFPLLALVACAIASSAAAGEFAGHAIRAAGRLAVAVAVFIITVNAAASARVARRIVATLVASGALVGAIAVLELVQAPFVHDLLTAFRPGFHVVGGQLRATSTLPYPTIASMYLEVIFALGLIWVASSRAAFAALAVIGAGVIATFTRAGLITMALSMIVFGALIYAGRRRWQREHSALLALAAVLVVLIAASRSPQLLVARMSTEGSQDWYGASYGVPATLTLRPGSVNDIPVALSNRGRLTWQSSAAPPFALSYHVLAAGTEDVVIYDGLRTPFEQPVGPGGEARLRARLRAPGYPGRYVVVWDIVQEHRTWLSLEGVFPERTLVTVDGAPVSGPLPRQGKMPSGATRMPRAVLWRTALQIWRDHPWLGIGPDSFRHNYGRHLGLAAWDTRVHANNSYLEVLAGMGLPGAAALAWLAAAAARSVPAIVAGAASLPLVAAALAACVAIAAHAGVDSFVTFTPTYAIFAIAAGLLYRHAHRV